MTNIDQLGSSVDPELLLARRSPSVGDLFTYLTHRHKHIRIQTHTYKETEQHIHKHTRTLTTTHTEAKQDTQISKTRFTHTKQDAHTQAYSQIGYACAHTTLNRQFVRKSLQVLHIIQRKSCRLVHLHRITTRPIWRYGI